MINSYRLSGHTKKNKKEETKDFKYYTAWIVVS